MKYNELEIVSGNIYKTFFKFTLPNMAGLIAMSSVALVDGYFVSNYVSSVALAAVNIIIPLITIIFGISIMLTIGAAVLIGKYLGEGKTDKASAVFTKVMITITFISLLFTLICYIFSKEVSFLLGANEEIIVYAVPYLKMISLFFLFQSLEYSLSVMIRTDGNPYLASAAVMAGAVLNFILDYIFIVKMNMGITGAALGTGISFMSSTFLILFHFFLKKGRLYITSKPGSFKEIIYAAYNGSSELLSEASVAVVAYLINNIMVQNMGTYGVEAFTVINYSLWAVNMLCYSVGDSLVPLISTNYGALKYSRIVKILFLSRISVLTIGITAFALFTFIPEKIIASLLSPESNQDAFNTALVFAYYVKYAFLFTGLNIIFSSSFTAFQKPLHSVIVALSRGLILPVAFIFIMPYFLAEKGLYMAVPLAETLTLFLGLILWKKDSVIQKVMGK
ncbi:MAG: MATE family efflux transporter [Candidatus Mucispirillum faecigallinarum]|nr:MATE family efflux transporter [Candidatus Mucispirillum faecigallinarum]